VDQTFPALDWRSVAARRSGARIGSSVLYIPELDSTNLAAAAQLPSCGDGAVVVADYQTAGHGRFGRAWLAAPGSSLLFTVVLAAPEQHWIVPLSAGLALVDALSRLLVEGRLKWPNDVLIDDRKCAGVLIEGRRAGGAEWLLLGIGLNVRAADSSLPDATFVDAHTRSPVAREDLLVELLARLEWWLERSTIDPASVREAWAAKLATLGERVAVSTAAGTIHGVAEGVANDGALLVRLADGSRTAVHAGDVTLA
jgi:BirA family biotin operon repressor/biotin-[acetyl-CoA-carboxylase] ligase